MLPQGTPCPSHATSFAGGCRGSPNPWQRRLQSTPQWAVLAIPEQGSAMKVFQPHSMYSAAARRHWGSGAATVAVCEPSRMVQGRNLIDWCYIIIRCFHVAYGIMHAHPIAMQHGSNAVAIFGASAHGQLASCPT